MVSRKWYYLKRGTQMRKTDSIRYLQRLGLNTHEMVITRRLEGAMAAAARYKEFTVRTDGTCGGEGVMG